jgi:D-inositol-3-phosphate glycosyltransferase
MNVYIRELSKELAQQGCKIDIFTRSQNPEVPMVVPFKKGIRIVHLKAGPESPYDKNQVWYHLPEFLQNVEQFTRNERGGYHLIHSHYWLSGWIGTHMRKRWNIPLLHMFHTLAYLKNKATRPLGEHEPDVRVEMEEKLVKQSDHIMVSNQREKVQMIWTYGVPTDKISVIPCGVDPALFRQRDPAQSKRHLGLPDKRYILFVGRIDPVKGIDTLLKAIKVLKQKLATVHNVHLLIIGGDTDHADSPTGSEMHKLKQLTATLGINNMVTFLGSQRQDQLPYFYSAAEVCILPSRYESFGMVALEAMACGTPVIASKVGGLSSFIQNDVSGLLIPEGDEVSLAEKIHLLLYQPSFIDTLASNARNRANEFTWPVISRQVLSLYQSLKKERTESASTLIATTPDILEGSQAVLHT